MATSPDAREVLLEEPFRLLFPLGVLATVAGLLPWVLFHLGLSAGWPAYDHGRLQMQGFGLLFATGFLMTAVPRFLESARTRPWELLLAVAAGLAGIAALAFGRTRAGELGFLVLAVHLTVFALRRLRGRGDDPPPFFAFLPVGFGCAVGGAGLILFPVPSLPGLGEALAGPGMLLCFVLAVGSHLGPRLLYGHRGFPETTTPAAHRRLALLLLLGLALAASFPLEAAGHPRAGLLLRAVIVTGYLFGHLRVYRRPVRGLLHLHLLRLSFWCVPAGLWLAALDPGRGPGALHLTFAGGFGLMSFVIATRVTVGHAGFEELWDRHDLALAGPLALLALSVPLRLAPDLLPQHLPLWIGASSALWILGAFWWGWIFVPKMAPRHVAED